MGNISEKSREQDVCNKNKNKHTIIYILLIILISLKLIQTILNIQNNSE